MVSEWLSHDVYTSVSLSPTGLKSLPLRCEGGGNEKIPFFDYRRDDRNWRRCATSVSIINGNKEKSVLQNKKSAAVSCVTHFCVVFFHFHIRASHFYFLGLVHTRNVRVGFSFFRVTVRVAICFVAAVVPR